MKPKNFVRMVQPRFVPEIEAGRKTQTIRLTPKRMPKAGDWISLRQWTGKPYRSKQRIVAEFEITSVERVEIGIESVYLGGRWIPFNQAFDFARADGFQSVRDMLDWFLETHDLPFTGICISWNQSGK